MKLNLNYSNLITLGLVLAVIPLFNLVSIASPSQDTSTVQSLCKMLKNDEKYQEAIDCFNNSSIELSEVYYNLADIYYLQGQYILSQRMLKKYFKTTDKDLERQVYVYSLQGLTETELGEYNNALSSYSRASTALASYSKTLSPEKLRQKQDDLKETQATINLSRGDLYTKLSEKGISYDRLAVTEYGAVLRAFFPLTETLSVLNEPTSSCEKLKEAQTAGLLDPLENPGILYKNLKAIVRLYQNQKYRGAYKGYSEDVTTEQNDIQYQEKLDCFITLIEEKYLSKFVTDIQNEPSLNISNSRTKALIYNYIGEAYAYLAKTDSKYYSKAQVNFDKAVDFSKNYNYIQVLSSKNLGDLYKNQGNLLQQDKKYNEMNDAYNKAIKEYSKIINLTRNKLATESNLLLNSGESISPSERILQDQVIENNFDIYANLIYVLSAQLKFSKELQLSAETQQNIKESIFQNMEFARTSVKEIPNSKNILKQLQDNTTLVEYFVTKEKTFVLLIEHQKGTNDDQKDITIDALPDSSQENIKKAIDQFYQYDLVEKGQSCNTKPCYPESLKTLYKILFQPIKNEIKTNNLIIIPHGLLRYVPFSALNDDQNKYLIQNYSSITMLPYANFLFDPSQTKQTELIKRRKKIKVVALANPVFDLPYSQKEVQSIEKNESYELKNPLYGQNATFEKLKAQLEENEPDILHLSTHNTVDSRMPEDTALYLSSEKLSINKVHNLPNLSGINLVILSACQTDTGEITKGDDVLNLTHTFLESVSGGVPSIVTTLWKIDDAASSQLMEQFYKNLAQGVSKAEALRQAQLTILNQANYSHPYYWAAFLLTGDSKPIIEEPKPSKNE
jgi:CHAT domain-containing protein